MASSATVSNPDVNITRSSELKRKMRRKTGAQGEVVETQSGLDKSRWRSEAEQQIYSSKLLEALRNVRRNDHTLSPVITGRAIRETADHVLSVTAKGKTRWSRAILTGRLSHRLIQINKKYKKAAKVNMKSKKLMTKKRRLPALQRKIRVLGRLVPGCKTIPLPNLLEETTDYIAALEMQIRAMTSLTRLLGSA